MGSIEGKGLCHDGRKLFVLCFTFIPGFQLNEGKTCIRLLTTGKNIHAYYALGHFYRRILTDIFQEFSEVLGGSDVHSTFRQLQCIQEETIIFLGNEGGRQFHKHEDSRNEKGKEHAQRYINGMGQFPENHAVDFNHTVKAVIEAVPHTVDSSLIRFLLSRFQKAGAEGRCQGKGGEGGKNDGNRNSQGKLLIQDTHNAAKEGNRYEYGSQHYGYADNRALHLLHGFHRSCLRIKVVVAHFVFHRFDHYDGIIYNQPDSKNHGEEGQGINGESKNFKGSKGAKKGYRHRNHRDKGRSPVLQEDIHNDSYQKEGFHKCFNNFLDRSVNEIGVIHVDDIFHIIREGFRVFRKLCLDGTDGLYRIGIIGQGEGYGGSFIIACSGNEVVILRIQLCTGHILQTEKAAVIVGTKHDIAEFFSSYQTAFGGDDILERLIHGNRRRADIAGGNLFVLVGYGSNDFGGGDIVLRHFGWIHPDTHGKVGTEFLHRTYAFDGFQFIQVVHAEIVFQEILIVGAVRRIEAYHQGHITGRFSGGNADASYRIRQACIGSGDTVLYTDSSQVGVRAHGKLYC